MSSGAIKAGVSNLVVKIKQKSKNLTLVKVNVPRGDDTEELRVHLASLGNRNTAEAVFLLNRKHIRNGVCRLETNGVDDETVFEFLEESHVASARDTTIPTG